MRKPRLSKAEKKMFQAMIDHFFIDWDSDGSDSEYYSKAEF